MYKGFPFGIVNFIGSPMLKIKAQKTNDSWLPVCGYESFYEISCSGDVRRIGASKKLSPTCNNMGYLYVSLSAKGRVKKFTLHRLVASTFLSGEGVVNHKDGNKQNNHVSNLEWVTYSENNKHAYKTGLKKPSVNTGYGDKNVYFKGVIVGTHIETGQQIRLAGKTDIQNHGFTHQSVYACVNGKLSHHKGFVFERIGAVSC